MIAADKRKAVYLLHQDGMSLHEIVRRLHLSRNTVRAMLKQKGEMPLGPRQDKIRVQEDLLRRLYADCKGWIERIHEKLVEEEGLEVSYSTVLRRVHELGLGQGRQQQRCGRVPDEPGEMQHDTSPYRIQLGTTTTVLIASMIYLRYSKRRFLRFYRRFNRFLMKCFLHEALKFWGYAAKICVIDNTSLARLRGTGAHAVMVPEMADFARAHGFRFLCHERGHANRKAGEERSFWTTETNFLPGRHFASLEDLNRQALQWATERMEHRPQGEGGIIPAEAFEKERPFLLAVPAHLPAPYLCLERSVDQYGYVELGNNYYWVPGTKRGDVNVLVYSDHLKIFCNRVCVMEYRLAGDGVRNERITPSGLPLPPHQPNNRKRPTEGEEKRLRALAPAVNNFLDCALATKSGLARHHFVRELFALSQHMTHALLVHTIERALRYHITDIGTLRRIARLSAQQGQLNLDFTVEVDDSFSEREAYEEGRLSEAPDLSVYDQIFEDDDAEDPHG
jgi:transposase